MLGIDTVFFQRHLRDRVFDCMIQDYSKEFVSFKIFLCIFHFVFPSIFLPFLYQILHLQEKHSYQVFS